MKAPTGRDAGHKVIVEVRKIRATHTNVADPIREASVPKAVTPMGRRTRVHRNLAVIRTVKADPKATARCGLSRTVLLARPVVHAKDYAMRKMIMKATARPAAKGIVTMARHPLAVKHRVKRKMITRDIARHGPTVIVPTAHHAVNVQSHGVVSQVRKVWKVAARRCLMKIDRQARRAIIVRGSMMRKTIVRDIVLQDPKEIVPMARLMTSGLKPVRIGQVMQVQKASILHALKETAPMDRLAEIGPNGAVIRKRVKVLKAISRLARGRET